MHVGACVCVCVHNLHTKMKEKTKGEQRQT